MISRQQIKIMLKNVTAAFNFMVAHTKPRHANTVVSWDDVADIIGQPAVNYIRTGDPVALAARCIMAILERGHNITTDGMHVYTSHPISADSMRDWVALRPALIRVIRRQS